MKFNEANCSCVIVDFSHATCFNSKKYSSCINKVITSGSAAVLLNVQDAEALTKILGFGVCGQCVIIKPYGNYHVVNALGIDVKKSSTCGIKDVTQNEEGKRCYEIMDMHDFCCQKDKVTVSSFQDISISEQADMIAAIVDTDYEQSYSSVIQNISSGNLPLHQFKMIYLTLEASWDIAHKQITNNSVVMEIGLFASFNPQYKYLRIRSLGAGFNPGSLLANGTYDRGFFQSKVRIFMQPQTSKLTVLSTEPKNVNGQTQYTSGSEFNVGVDISKNPGFNANYTISQSRTTQISDFNIYNNGAGITADWDFSLSMVEKSMWDVFYYPFARMAQVKELPALATRNLQPVTESVWFGSNNLIDNIGIRLTWEVTHCKCWSTGNWAIHRLHYYNPWRSHTNLFHVDFSSVFA